MNNEENTILAIYNPEIPFFQNYNHLSSEVRKISFDDEGNYKIQPFYDLSKYKNVRSLKELGEALNPNELIALEISAKYKDQLPECQFLNKPEEKEKKKANRRYLVNYDFEIKNFNSEIKKSFIPVLLEKNIGEDIYKMSPIIVINDYLEHRDEEINSMFGGYSGIYFELTNPDIIMQYYKDDVLELIQVSENNFKIMKLPEYLKPSYNKTKKIAKEQI